MQNWGAYYRRLFSDNGYPGWFIEMQKKRGVDVRKYYSANNVVKITPQGVATILVDKLDKPYGLHVNGNMLFITCQGSNSIYRQKI